MKYKHGTVMGGRNLVHDCGVSRSFGYFLEPMIVIGLFANKLISIRIKGITNNSKDPCVDSFRSTTIPVLKRFGVPSEGLGLKIENRGFSHLVNWLDEGMVKRNRGVTYSTRVSSQFENTMIHTACGIFNCLLPDVHIFTDNKAGPQAGKSSGYGISLVAETTSSCFISSDTAVSYALGEAGEIDNDDEEELMPPENVGEEIASFLLEDIQKGGVVDPTHQGFYFFSMHCVNQMFQRFVLESCRHME